MNTRTQLLSLPFSIVAVFLCLGPYSGAAPPDLPIGSIIAWNKTLTGVPTLPAGWVECAGGNVSDSRSPLNGQSIPNLNSSTNRFLRGNTTSGTVGGTTTHVHIYSGATEIEDGDTDVVGSVDSNSCVPAGCASGLTVTVGGLGHIHSYSGTTDPGNHTHEPPFMDVVWIMR